MLATLMSNSNTLVQTSELMFFDMAHQTYLEVTNTMRTPCIACFAPTAAQINPRVTIRNLRNGPINVMRVNPNMLDISTATISSGSSHTFSVTSIESIDIFFIEASS